MTAVLTEPVTTVTTAGDEALTELTARVVPVEGLLARVAVLLNPYDVRELTLSLEHRALRVLVAGDGFDAGRVEARLDKVIGVLDVCSRVLPSTGTTGLS